MKENKKTIRVAILGCGWFGKGLLTELFHWEQIEPRVVFSRDIGKVKNILVSSKVREEDIAIIDRSRSLKNNLNGHKFTICNNPDFLEELESIDVVLDATGNILLGAKAALTCFNKGIHFVTASSELDATIGVILNEKAKEKGVIYSNCDGDQPGVLARLIDEVESFGFQTVLAGNCKGFLDVHKTPDDILQWVGPGQKANMTTSFTDGTKQSLELAVVANGFGLKPDVRGMHGLKTTKQTLVEDFMSVVNEPGIVDFCLGINGIDQGGGVFVIAKRDGDSVHIDMKYLKKGNGPHYLFFRDHHLCYFEAPRSILDVMVNGKPTLAAKVCSAEVIALAKSDLKAGTRLDGIGGYTTYGVIEKAEVAYKENLLPVGLSEWVVLKKNVEKDIPISFNEVDFIEDNIVIELKKDQERILSNQLNNKASEISMSYKGMLTEAVTRND